MILGLHRLLPSKNTSRPRKPPRKTSRKPRPRNKPDPRQATRTAPRKLSRKLPRKAPRKSPQTTPNATREPQDQTPAKDRGPVLPIGKPRFFDVRTHLAKATGVDKRYKFNAVRVLPVRKKDTVILQASDGTQAVCVLARGRMDMPRLVPSQALPSKIHADGTVVALAGGQWRSSDGQSAADQYAGENGYPSVSMVLPKMNGHAKSSQIKLGLDLEVLSKVAASLGTSKLTLFITPPRKSVSKEQGGSFVNKAVAVCPATDEGKVRGVGVLLPLKPENGVAYYTTIRQLVERAEERCRINTHKTGAGPRSRPV